MFFLFLWLIGSGGALIFNSSAGDVLGWIVGPLLLGWYFYVSFSSD